MIQNIFSLNYSTLWMDFAENWSISFQDPASPWMYAIIDLHDRIMFYLIILLIVVVWFLISATLNTNPMNFHHGNLIELIWTLTPAGILWAIGLPSLKLLYMIDEILDAEITIKAIGNQWYNTNAINKSNYFINKKKILSTLELKYQNLPNNLNPF